jgi:nucleotidyltransferase/DNA polymerase involved in DNA repair
MLNSPRETNKVYGIDGDKVGGLIDALFIRNEINAMSVFSAKVASAMDEIRNAVIQGKGSVVFCAGDSILFQGNFEEHWCEKILHLFLTMTGLTASMGVGNTATEAYLALKLAKADGGGRVIHFSPCN